ncbi:MAG: LytTR family DNA-binding domain-containing protein [Lachnospiraceae bacterium]|nr:LytTR family DNA-binding domain-containing protein [Lachnospiraceae bacterium]
MIRIVIAEDMEPERRRLAEYIRRYEETHDETFQVSFFPDGLSLVEEYPKDCDILFLDIEMKPMNGMDAAKAIRTADENVVIIFITNLVQYALEGYTVNALNFIIKPVDYETFAAELTRALGVIVKRTPHFLTVKNREGTVLLDIRDITYVETSLHKTVIHTRTREIPSGETMNALENRLAEFPFFRCHTAYLVNLNYVDRFQGCDVWVAGTQLAISRHRRKDFLEALAEYIGGLS